MTAAIFDLAADLLEKRTSFNRLEARGTLRLALEEAGLDSATVTLDQLRVVFEKLMPAELEKRSVCDAAALARSLWEEIECSAPAGDASTGPSIDDTFRRLSNA